MNYQEYNDLFEQIKEGNTTNLHYTDALNAYTILNKSRQERWIKKGELLPETIAFLKGIQETQKWVLITEPWCGDAAQVVPFIQLMAQQNPLIQLEIQLRDSDSQIEQYLTNGSKSIPVLIVRNAHGEDLFHWGPRPSSATAIHLKNKDLDIPQEKKKVELQQWYNSNKGVEIQKEILQKFQSL